MTAKQAAGETAASLIEEGMVVGLGTGSTAAYFIEALAKRKLSITAIASSKQSEKLAKGAGIKLADLNEVLTLDVYVDGTDEIDVKKRMIKGGGGALLREKIVASSSQEMIVIVDASKKVSQLGAFPLPVEIIPFGYKATLNKLRDVGFDAHMRLTTENALFVTDNGNLIADIHFNKVLEDPERIETLIQKIPGIVETGFFFNLAGRVIIGKDDGTAEIWS